jgi:adenosylmethionine-8-amino-7-oxononanoate aminotransferase
MKHHETFPLIALSHGQGAWLYDEDGHRYLDAISSWWVNLFGHANPTINQALRDQLETLEHAMLAGFTHRPVIELSERLSNLTNKHLGHVFYASDGASAIEIALKMSFHFWRNSGKTQKREFVCLTNSYHGETMGALRVTDVGLFKDAYGDLIQSAHLVASPDARQANSNQTSSDVAYHAISSLKQVLEQHHETIAAFIVEPLVQCATGMAMYDPVYLQEARRLCDQYDIHLIADEIAVGCGRTGTFFACEQADIWPDFLALSKGISGGYLPLSLVMTRDDIYQAFYHDDVTRGFLHSHSYTGNPLACRAALATLDIFEKQKILTQNQILIKKLTQAFSWADKDSRIENLRQCGTILAFDVKSNATQTGFAKKFFSHGLANEILVRPIGNTVYVMPPYILSDTEISHLGAMVEKTLNQTISS